jgi:hypothetical protein
MISFHFFRVIPLIIVITLFTFFSCSNIAKNRDKPNKTKEEIAAENAESELESQGEKIALLSVLNECHLDTTRLILKEYLYLNFQQDLYEDSIDLITLDIIKNISKKTNIKPKKIASIIFSYKYEMLTKDDIITEHENYIEKIESDIKNYESNDFENGIR